MQTSQLTLRPYQRQAVDRTFSFLEHEKGDGLIVLPTGTGKSVVIAELARHSTTAWAARIIIATHSKELVKQNHDELLALWPDAPAGIYSAGLGQRNIRSAILFASIQSVYKKAYKLQRCDLLLIDECHTLSKNDASRWGLFILELRQINPHMRVVGLSATPYRMDSGSLLANKLFDSIIFDYNLLDAVSDGYLCEITTHPTETHLHTAGVAKRGGEFVAGELERAVNVDAITKAAVVEIVRYKTTRKCWLVFAAGVAHANAIAEEIRQYGITCEAITGETPAKQRDLWIEQHKSGTLQCLVNNNVLTTGYNNPRVDLIACLRPTGSAGLWVQMLGRGMRLFWAKLNCLLLDFAGNSDRFGPIDRIKATERNNDGTGEAPIKSCPTCHAFMYAGARQCANCGYEFPEGELDINRTASKAPVLSTQIKPVDYNVTLVSYTEHVKAGKKSLRVEYLCDLRTISEWVCFEHSGRARDRAIRWWQSRTHTFPPRTVKEALDRVRELRKPRSIAVVKEGKYDRVVSATVV